MAKENMMPQKKYTDEVAKDAVAQAKAGTPVADILKSIGVTPTTFYKWKAKYDAEYAAARTARAQKAASKKPVPAIRVEGDMARRVAHLERENTALKVALADQVMGFRPLNERPVPVH